MGVIEGLPTLQDGASYKVIWNDKEYICTYNFLEGETDSDDTCYIGNGSIVGLNATGEPFLIAQLISDPTTNIVAQENFSTETVTVKITTMFETVHKLDNKYLDIDWLPRKKSTQYTEILSMTIASGFHTLSMDIIAKIQMIENLQEASIIYDDTTYSISNIRRADTVIYLGNEYLFNTSLNNTGEPFLMIIYLDNVDTINALILFQTTGNHAISISANISEYEKVPDRYLPYHVLKYDLASESFDSEFNDSVIQSQVAISRGRHVYATYNGKVCDIISITYTSDTGYMAIYFFINGTLHKFCIEYNNIQRETIAYSSESKVFYVTVTADENGNYTADKRYEEIVAAHNAGRVVYCKYTNDNNTHYLPLSNNSGLSGIKIHFFRNNVLSVYIDNNNVVQLNSISSVTSVNGQTGAVTLSTSQLTNDSNFVAMCVVTMTSTSPITLDKTFEDVYNAISNGQFTIIRYAIGSMMAIFYLSYCSKSELRFSTDYDGKTELIIASDNTCTLNAIYTPTMFYLTSPNGTRYQISVNDDGTLTTSPE